MATLNGQIDTVTPYRVLGWAQDPERPSEPVTLVVTNNGEILERTLADVFREDVRAAGFGTGAYGFDVWLPARLSPARRNVVRVFRESDGRELLYSPTILEPTDAFGPVLRARLSDLLRAPMEAPALNAAIDFFAGVLDGLKQRAADELSQAEPRARARGAAASGIDIRSQPRALVIDDALPDPTRDAGSLAILSHIRSFARLGYEVSFLPSDLLGARTEPVTALESEGIVLYLSPQVGSVEEVLRRQPAAFDVVYVHRISNADRYAPLVRAFQPMALLIYGVADLHHIRMERQGALDGCQALLDEGRRMRLREFLAASQASAVVTHSEVEAALLRVALPKASVTVVPWAVRTNVIVRPFARRRHLAFVGGYRHAPNVAAAHRLVEAIMPRVWRTHPAIKCFLVGSDMPDDLLQLDVDGIETVGHVPDLFLALNRVRLTVAPLTWGAGVKGKVLESMAHGLPCVMSGVAAEGLRLPPELQACVAADDDVFAQAIIELHEDEAVNAERAAAGLRFIEQGWSEERVDDALRSILEGGTNAALRRR